MRVITLSQVLRVNVRLAGSEVTPSLLVLMLTTTLETAGTVLQRHHDFSSVATFGQMSARTR